MKENPSPVAKSKKKKILLSIFAVILFIALVFPFALDFYLKKKLPSLVNNNTAYQITLKDFDMSLFKGNISAKDIVIKTKPTKDTSVTKIDGVIKDLEIENFGIWDALIHKSYQVKNIKLLDPQLTAILGKSKKKNDTLKKPLNFGVENILVTNGNFSVKNAEQRNIFTGKDVSIHLTEIAQSKDASKLPLAFKDFKIDAQNVLITVNDFYQIIASKIDAKNKQLSVTDFHLKPIESPSLYNAKNVFDLKIKNLLADNFTIDKDSLIIDNANFLAPQLIVTSTNKQSVKNNPKEVNLKIGIKNLDLREGNVLVQRQNKLKVASAESFHVQLKDIVFDKNTVKEKVPFKFSTHDVEVDNIYFRADDLQAVSIGKIASNNDNIFITKASFDGIAKSNSKDVYNVKTEKIDILKNKTKFNGQQLQVNLGAINIHQPKIEIVSATHKKKSAAKAKSASPNLILNLAELNMINGSFSQKSVGKEKLAVQHFDVKVNGISTNSAILKEAIPFKVRNHLVTAKNINYDAGKYYKLKVGGLKHSGKVLDLSNFAFLPKYSRDQFNKMIAVEEDLYTIKAKSVQIADENSQFGKNPSINLKHVLLTGLDCNIYHDLAPPDDNAIRYMFSKKLRDVKFPLFVKAVELKNSKLVYEEITEKAMIPGKLTFNDFNAKISNVNSAKMKGKPTMVNVDANFKFFGTAPTQVNWNFDVADKNDNYAISGMIKNLSVENANLFVRPYLNVTLDGKIDYLKFDYKGDGKKIGGNFYFKYNDMHVNFLNKNTGKERKVLSAIANIFVKNDSKGEPNHVEIEKDRDPKKSFFNTLLQGIMEGLKKYLI